MAKKAKTGPKPEAKPEPSTLAVGKRAVRRAAKKVTKAVTAAAAVVQEHVVTPVTDAVGITKPKKPRFVREKKPKKVETKAAPLPPRSTKASGKLMSKNLAVPPKDDPKGLR